MLVFLSLLLSLFACSPAGTPAPIESKTAAVAAALDGAGLTALALRDDAASKGDSAACVAWSAVAAVAPMGAEVVAAWKTQTQIPGIDWDASACGVAAPVTDTSKISTYISLGAASAKHVVETWHPTSPAECTAHAVAADVVAWVDHARGPVLDALEAGSLKVTVPVTPLSPASCK